MAGHIYGHSTGIVAAVALVAWLAPGGQPARASRQGR
jgi:hypothetical protein